MKISTFNSQKGPKAVGPYSTAKIHNHTVYVSGQLPLDPSTGSLVSENLEQQVKRAMQNLRISIEELGCSLDMVLRCTLYLSDMNDFATVNGIYGQYFKKDPPARTAYAVKTLPKGARFEIDAIVAYPHQAKL